MDALTRAAHSLKGSAGDISAFSLWEAAAEVEQLARNAEQTAIPAAQCRLQIELGRVLQAVPLRLNELAISAVTNDTPPAASALPLTRGQQP
jgi:HPt (histidine-containing phosphotransfer) domain-containing protein